MDPIDFLRQHAPFSELSERGRELVASRLEIDYVVRGHEFLREGGEPARELYVLRKGEAERIVEGQTVERLGPGDAFGFASLLSNDAASATVRAEQDCLVLSVPGDVFASLVRDEPALAAFFLQSLAGRLRGRTGASPGFAASLATSVATLIRRDAVLAPESLCVQQAAALMADEGIGSLLLHAPDDRGTIVGIVTDRDLRRRVLARGRDGAVPVADVMSHPVVTLSHASSLFDAMMCMLERDVRHLPIVDACGHAQGLISYDDLVRHLLHSPVSTLARLRRLTLDGVAIDHARDVAGLVSQLLGSGLGAVAIGSMVATLNDALVAQLCRLAEDELGPPPSPYAWIVFGSEGRREQALLTDQDNALVYAGGENPDQATHDYFARLADRVVTKLVECGVPPCQGGYMATNWCMSERRWVETLDEWSRTPTPEAVMHAANLFDFRPVHGDLGLGALERAVLDSVTRPRFVTHFARQVLDKRPHDNLFSRWLDLDRTVDLKGEALVPIVGLARIYGLLAGQRGGSTRERLAAASAGGELDEDRAESLSEAFEFVFRLRLEHHLEAHRRGRPPTNELRLGTMAALDRRHLRDCLAYIADAQRALQRRLGSDGAT